MKFDFYWKDVIIMTENIDMNEIITGMILIDSNENRYVVIETDLNGDDEYFSRLRIISEEEYLQYRGKSVYENQLQTAKWIEEYEYRREYRISNECYKQVGIERMFKIN